MHRRVTVVRLFAVRLSVALAFATFATVRLGAQASSAAAGATPATGQPPAESLQRANALFVAANWSASRDAYAALAKQFPRHPLSRFRLGVSQMELGAFTDAEANLRQGEQLGIPAAQGAFRLAQLRVEQHRPDDAIAELTRSVQAQLPLSPAALAADVHLKTLTSHPKWAGLLDALDAITRPCMHDAKHREFDFWVGDWDVRGVGQPAVGPAARNTITLEEDGCVVMEHWKTPTGSTGQSFNLFDRSIGRWRQTWVDNSGGQHVYSGTLIGRDMVLEGDTPAANGQRGRIPTRLTLFHISKDSVRQFSQTSPDSGKTWVTAYDLLYVRRRGTP